MKFLGRKDRTPPPSALVADAIPPGTLLGGVIVGQRLASGAQGTVYAAADAVQGTPLALKALPAPGRGSGDQGEDAARARFLADGERATQLVHPAIVRVHGGGISRGVAFLVMERLAGAELSTHARPGRLLPEPLVLEIAARIAEALSHAHRLGVVHRDVKPENLVFDATTRSVKLADFGLARHVDADASRSGAFLGSPHYMAPELLAGAPPGAATDLYALGVTVFELLTGASPIAGATLGELLRSVAERPALHVGQLRLDLAPAQAAALDALVRPLLAKSPRDRPHDGDAWAVRARAAAALWPTLA
jgi:serine/threonine protein kinase